MNPLFALLLASAASDLPAAAPVEPQPVRAVAIRASASVVVLRAERASAQSDDPQAAHRQVRRNAAGLAIDFE